MAICVAAPIDVALLGCGNVGSAFARLAAERSRAFPLTITGALIRNPTRARAVPSPLALSTDARALLDSEPGLIVELLGGEEPARTLLQEALRRRIPVVTANKTLLARHGAELRKAAADTDTPLLCEAAVLAGVPFLGTFARRPEAAAARSIVGIANGTSNHVLTRCSSLTCDVAAAVLEAQQLGYAEPDPHSDLSGIDAAEKLSVLLQHFAVTDVHPDAFDATGIDSITPGQFADAQLLGGVIKPIVYADWTGELEAFVGPAFIHERHLLARVDGVDNALLIDGRHGRLLFQGPGAGPEVTAATVLDDVAEIAAGTARAPRADLSPARPGDPETGWMVTLEAPRLPRPTDIADLFASHGLFARRTAGRATRDGRDRQSMLLWPTTRARLEDALRSLDSGVSVSTATLRTLEATA